MISKKTILIVGCFMGLSGIAGIYVKAADNSGVQIYEVDQNNQKQVDLEATRKFLKQGNGRVRNWGETPGLYGE